MSFLKEIERRRTFGIISHPDAGKTTLTEKLLLFGGAIQEAGAVKNNKIKKGATSDFMEIERQRGISVSTSVLAFNYNDKKINILDTPGHKDFAEDTFRTLTAVDSVIVVIDVAKGVEEQTEKLVSVCRMRNIPIIVFINKLDREGKDAFDLMDEVEQKLGLSVTPLSFPIGMGYDFQGIYNLWEQNINLFSGDSRKNIEETIAFSDVTNPELEKIIGQIPADRLREELELIDEVYPKFNREDYLDGKLQPVFFGSALNNFGVRELLDCFVEIAPSPRPKDSETRLVDPKEEKMTGFVFKIHANMDPKHRDRIAFLRICSGKYEKGLKNYLVQAAIQLFASTPNPIVLTDEEKVALEASSDPYTEIIEPKVIRVMGEPYSDDGCDGLDRANDVDYELLIDKLYEDTQSAVEDSVGHLLGILLCERDGKIGEEKCDTEDFEMPYTDPSLLPPSPEELEILEERRQDAERESQNPSTPSYSSASPFQLCSSLGAVVQTESYGQLTCKYVWVNRVRALVWMRS